jgi:hypothetical protein
VNALTANERVESDVGATTRFALQGLEEWLKFSQKLGEYVIMWNVHHVWQLESGAVTLKKGVPFFKCGEKLVRTFSA